MRTHSTHQLAAAALARTGPRPLELLVVSCSEGHPLAQVVRTDLGPVVVCQTAIAGEEADLLDDAFVGDELSAWCACGAHSLSRRWVLAQVYGDRHVVPV